LNRGAYTHTAGVTKGTKARADRRCSDCLHTKVLQCSRGHIPLVNCTKKHWRSYNEMTSLPEDIAQTCPDWDDMDENVG